MQRSPGMLTQDLHSLAHAAYGGWHYMHCWRQAGKEEPGMLVSCPIFESCYAKQIHKPQMCHSRSQTDVMHKSGKPGCCEDFGKGNAEQFLI